MTPRQKWNAHVGETLATWRSFTSDPPISTRYNIQLIRSAIADSIAIRLRIAYDPLFVALKRIERNVQGIADLASNRDPWAPKPKHQPGSINRP